ncbi:MAG: chemotaxis protein CheD [Pseudomonadota bacterium]
MRANTFHITQGEHMVSDQPGTVITTLLGSCVACCLWDPEARVGGMNHMLLSVRTTSYTHCNTAGVNAMEVLINDIIKLGGVRGNLKAKVFGGAQMVSGLSEIGISNGRFVLEFLEREGITCESHSLGGVSARMLKYWPTEGRVLQKIASSTPVVPEPQVLEESAGNAPELF